MTNSPTRVAIVVDPDFGSALAHLAKYHHVWVVDTPPNRRAAEQVWASGASSTACGVATFKVDSATSSETWVEDLLSTIDEHHGLRADWAADVELEVRGTQLTPALRVALQEFGPFSLEERTNGFVATRHAV